MSDLQSTRAAAPVGIDLTQFHQVFFGEAGENLDTLEQLLVQGDLQAAGDEELNAIFRCAHSVKGGAATFGFQDVAELTHEMETLLDKLRRHELAAAPPMVDVLLRAGDALKAMLAAHRGSADETVDTTGLVQEIRRLAGGAASVATPTTEPVRPIAPPSPDAPTLRVLELTVDVPDRAVSSAIEELFREVVGLGTLEAMPADAHAAGGTARRFRVTTASSEAELLDLLSFHVPRDAARLAPWPPAGDASVQGPAGREGFGLFDGAPGAPKPPSAGSAPAAASPGGPQGAAPKADARHPASEATLRVSVEKVDQLINLVGELVITQAMLAQNTKGVDPALHQQLALGLADLERNTRDLQESVMSIRMIPMSVVFSRFPRMLRDLAAKLGKKVEFVTQGEATELDKGLVEKITDPLTHLVRNSCDHGIEAPDERVAKGKPAAGTITLAASHQGGNIVIEVRDDGRGLSRAKLLAKARERGLDAPDTLADAEVWALIFAPGFSTAETVTDVSGRGVGMDVVKKNITALGGTVEIDSAEGHGMSVKVRLPLTLAIMESMSVGVADECYILPLSSVVESFQPTPERLRTVGGTARLVNVRDEYLPVIELERVFDVPRRAGATVPSPVMVVVEADGVRVALVVDELLGQQQVVVKNLEANYRRVENVSGATIMGDGRVALILDVGALVRRARH